LRFTGFNCYNVNYQEGFWFLKSEWEILNKTKKAVFKILQADIKYLSHCGLWKQPSVLMPVQF